jgi:hypothetical protein
MTLNRIPMPSPSYSSRGGATVRLLVVHTAEGATTIESLGNWFANPANAVSSHAGADDKANTIGVYVKRADKAWTQGNANPVAVSIEACGFAHWGTPEWDRHPNMLANIAAWLAEESAAFGVPLVKLTPTQAQGSGRGVCQHIDLGSWGGGHVDCGPGFPMDRVLAMAGGATSGPPPAAATGWKGRNMIAATSTGKGYWTVTHDGAVNAFGDAQYKGGGFNPDIITGEVVGIAGHGIDGYWLHSSDGGVHAFGSAPYLGRPDRF